GRPVNSFASGFVEDGWDWNRVPGTTTIHLPLEKLENPLPGTLMERSEENFSGASSLEGKQGVFVFKLKEKDRENFTPGFVARKSVFCFENRLVCLGSNISNNNKEYPTETTLFQLALKRNSEPILLGSDTIVGLPIEKTISEKSSVLLSDTKGNYYRIAAGQDLRILRQKQKSRDNKQKSETEGKFVTAYLNHGVSPDNAEYEYMVLVQPTPDQAKEIASEEGLPYQILRKDHYAHIVKDIPSGTVGYVMFETLDNIKDDYLLASDAETLILLRPTDKKTLVMSICDPNLNLEEKTYTTAKPSRPLIKSILLKGKWKNVSDNDEVVIKQENGNTRLTATCIDGRPVEFKLIAQ
ncbi:MAG: chondroitinase, partial [Coprobacter fastidiosus]